jgi:hypothetical protein
MTMESKDQNTTCKLHNKELLELSKKALLTYVFEKNGLQKTGAKFQGVDEICELNEGFHVALIASVDFNDNLNDENSRDDLIEVVTFRATISKDFKTIQCSAYDFYGEEIGEMRGSKIASKSGLSL